MGLLSRKALAFVVVILVVQFKTTAGEISADPQHTSVQVARQKREHSELIAAAKGALRASHAAKTSAQRDSAARQLVDAFVELQDDQSLSIGERESLFHQVRNRLLAIEQGLRSVLNRERDIREPSASASARSTSEKSSKPAVPLQIDTKNRPQVLAQQMGPAVPPNGAQPPVNNSPNGGQQAKNDYGQELLDLIQRVIRPSTWDINGGPSSGYYYQPLHALVISAPAEVHEEIGGVLGGLRK